jgi:hypothetical protein
MFWPLCQAIIEKRLQDEGGGDLVYNAAMCLSSVPGLVEDLVRFVAGEVFIPEVYGKLSDFAQVCG